MNCFVTTVDLALADKLKHDLIQQGFELTQPQHTIFQAQKKGISCTLYSSGKLTVQGKDKEEFISFYLEPEILGHLKFSYPEIGIDMTPRIGIDEAGKGDFFGPLCVGGAQAGEAQIKALLSIGVKDSKTMSDGAVIKLSQKIKQIIPYTIVRISPPKYNELYTNFRNLNSMLAWGHAKAISDLVQKTSCQHATIDQFASEHLVENALKRMNLSIDLKQQHKGEADPVIAAASILARAAFLEGLEKLGESVGMVLPKGASKQVIEAGKRLVAKHGEAILGTVAKLHFKTRTDILS